MFLLSGLSFTEFSDNRLWANRVTPAEFAKVAWWGALYLCSMAAASKGCSLVSAGLPCYTGI